MFWNLSTWPVLETHQLHAFLPLVTQRGGRIRNGRCKNAHFIQPLESRSKTSHRGVYCVFFLQRTPVPLSCDKKREQNPAVTAYMKRSISLVEKSCLNTCSLHLRRRKKKKKNNSRQSVFMKLNGSAFGINSESRLGVTAWSRGTLPP